MRFHQHLGLCCFAWALLACGGADDDAPGDDPDAAPPACSPTAEIGHCIDQATGEPCLEFDAAVRNFIPLGQGTVVQPIIGPQAAEMYVLAIRGLGIDPGTIEDPPRTDVVVLFAGEERGRFTSFPDFFPDPTSTGTMVAPQLFTVVFEAAALDGESVTVLGRVTNPGDDGEEFCAETTFVGGALIEPPP